MNNPSTTYTLLVTIAHDAGAALSTDLLEVMVQRGLEEGVREFAGVHAATVSALEHDRLEPYAANRMGDEKTVAQIRKLHSELRTWPPRPRKVGMLDRTSTEREKQDAEARRREAFDMLPDDYEVN